MRAACTLLLVLFLMLGCAPTHAANSHGTPDALRELQSWFGDAFMPFLVPNAGCPPAPIAGLTFAAFPCKGYVRGTAGDLVYVTQAAHSVGPLASGNGTYWLALHRDTSTAVSGWTRQAGTSYLWQFNASRPSEPTNGLVFAQVTVAGGVITLVVQVAPSAPQPSVSLALSPLEARFGGAVCGPVALAQAALNRVAVQAAITESASNPLGPRVVATPCQIFVDTSLVLSGLHHITLWAPPQSPQEIFDTAAVGGFTSLDPTAPILWVKNNGGTQSDNILLEGLDLQYSSNANAGVKAILFTNSGGEVKHCIMVSSTIADGIGHMADAGGPAGEMFFLFITDHTRIVSRGTSITATNIAGQVSDLYIYDGLFATIPGTGTNLDVSGTVVLLVHNSLIVNGTPNVFLHAAGGNGPAWATFVGTHLESSQGNALLASDVGHLEIQGGKAYQGTCACAAIEVGNNVLNGVISGMDIRTNVGKGIHLTGTAKNVLIGGNTFYANNANAAGGAVLIDNTVTGSMVAGNNATLSGGASSYVNNAPTQNSVGANGVDSTPSLVDFQPGLSMNGHPLITDGTGKLVLDPAVYGTGGVSKSLCVNNGVVTVGTPGC